jgi:hypothetical protein
VGPAPEYRQPFTSPLRSSPLVVAVEALSEVVGVGARARWFALGEPCVMFLRPTPWIDNCTLRTQHY